MRTQKTFHIIDSETFKTKALTWAQQFDDVVWLDSNGHSQSYGSFDAILAVDAFTALRTDYLEAFEKLKEYQSQTEDWLFGYLTYDLKNDIEDLSSNNLDHLGFPDLYFFQPKRLFVIKGDRVELHYLRLVDDELETDFKNILDVTSSDFDNNQNSIEKSNNAEPIKIRLRTHKDAYFQKVDKMLDHIKRGDIYEANFCQEFFAVDTKINPIETYQKLNTISKPPFATFLKMENRFLLSASPERYLKKEGSVVISQPIKGTAKRSKNAKEDNQLKAQLANDPKERSENIMIVDLVRNDLSQTAIKGSVKVTELCKVYTFEQVHQMISTVTSRVEDTTHPVDIIATTFPMGSMTGAPKISAMRIIEDLEDAKRGLYSGAVGYFKPNGDFDFNVVIRSILYNAVENYVSYSVGSAITSKSISQNEYEECLIKAKAMRTVLEN